MDSSHGKPRWVNYAPSTPLPKGSRSYFSHNIVRTVHIRIDLLAGRRTKQAAFDSLPLVLLMLAYWLHIQEAAL
jgi:hypothetical protein